MPRTTADPEFGTLLARRGPSRQLTLFIVLILVIVAALALVNFGAWRHSGLSALSAQAAAIVSGMMAVMLVIAALAIRANTLRIEFFERGVQCRGIGRASTRLPYNQCVSHEFAMEHLRRHGGYTGTAVTFVLRAADGRRVRYHEVVRHKVSEFGSAFNSTYALLEPDPVEAVARRVAGAMFQAWIARIKAGESVEWTHLATLAPNGIASWHGASKGTLALYSELLPIEFGGLHASISMRDGTPFARLSTVDANFYPGYLAASFMIARHAPDDQGSAVHT